MRVLISGYSPRTHTSYGTIIKELWSRLLCTGDFDIGQHAWFNIPSQDDVPWKLWDTKKGVLPGNKLGFVKEDEWGQESFEPIVSEFRPDIVWCLSDIYMSKYLDQYKSRYNFKLVRWTLSEGEPVDRSNIPYIEAADKTVAITNYAANLWSEITGETYDVIPHGVDANTFMPVTKETRTLLRKEVTAGELQEDDFVLLYVGRNQQRKNPWLIFEVLHYLRTGAWGWTADGLLWRYPWDPVKRTHDRRVRLTTQAKPINAKLWIHSSDDGTRWRYDKLEQEWNLEGSILRTVGYTDINGLSTQDMACIYQMADALCMLSGSEGFGVPLIEAAACGIPAVYTDYSGHGEVGRICEGLPVSYNGWQPAPVTHVRWVYPDVNKAIRSFYDIAVHPHMCNGNKELRERVSDKIRSEYSQDAIAKKWHKTLREVHERPVIKTYGEVL